MLTAAPSDGPQWATTAEQAAIDGKVDDDHPTGQNELRLAREPGRIEDRQREMLDEDDEGQVKEQDSFSGQAMEHRWNALE